LLALAVSLFFDGTFLRGFNRGGGFVRTAFFRLLLALDEEALDVDGSGLGEEVTGEGEALLSTVLFVLKQAAFLLLFGLVGVESARSTSPF
jgi:hypothetical protein